MPEVPSGAEKKIQDGGDRMISLEMASKLPNYKTRLYRIHTNMMGRCYREYNSRFRNYGARGIKVCDEWHNFEAFKKWALENGYNDGLSIDRKDNDGDYTPANCKWANRYEQANNTSANHKATINGVTKTVAEWSRISGIRESTLRNRINTGWPLESILRPVIKPGGNRRNPLVKQELIELRTSPDDAAAEGLLWIISQKEA